ncbi:MAG: NAD(P)/FAD-dependent oxidoreductase [Anaeromyxobacter sp.]
MDPMNDTTLDALIVGARAAGAATGLLLARAGLRVAVVDRGQEGQDTLLTHALMRGGVLQLRRWGLLDRLVAAGTPPVRSATFHYGDETVGVQIKPRDGVEALYAPRRTVLDPLLVSAAREAGAEVRHGLALRNLERDGAGRVVGARLVGLDGAPLRVRAHLVIGADGLGSTVASQVGAAVQRAGHHATAVLYAHLSGLPVEGYHWFYASGVSAGAIPTDAGRTCLFVAVPPARFRAALPDGLEALYREALAEAAPALAARLGAAQREGKLHPFTGRPGFLRQAWGPGWALVGDAGAFRDPITAHGLTDALRDAELLARAVITEGEAGLAGYQAARDQAAGGLLEVSDRIAALHRPLEAMKADHQQLARLLAAEVELLRGLDGDPDARAAAGA